MPVPIIVFNLVETTPYSQRKFFTDASGLDFVHVSFRFCGPSRGSRFRERAATRSSDRTVYVARLQQLSAGGSVAIKIQNRTAALERFRAARLPCRLLGSARLARSICGQRMDRTAISVFVELENRERLHARLRSRWT